MPHLKFQPQVRLNPSPFFLSVLLSLRSPTQRSAQAPSGCLAQSLFEHPTANNEQHHHHHQQTVRGCYDNDNGIHPLILISLYSPCCSIIVFFFPSSLHPSHSKSHFSTLRQSSIQLASFPLHVASDIVTRAPTDQLDNPAPHCTHRANKNSSSKDKTTTATYRVPDIYLRCPRVCF